MDFCAVKDIRRRAVDLTIWEESGQPSVAKPLVFHVVDETLAEVVQPSVTMSLEDAAGLMTELWNAGVRPEGVGTVGEIAALKHHLEDMRKLVFQTKPTV